MSFAAYIQLWRNFWFTKECPAPICVLRIGYGVLILTCAVLWLPNMYTFFGPHGLVSASTILNYASGPRFSLLFLLPPTDTSVTVVFTILVVAAALVTIGLFTRASLAVLFICLISFQQRNPMLLNSGDILLSVVTMILLFSPSGEMFSVDRWLREPNASTSIDQWQTLSYRWTTRLIQLQIAAIYCQSFWGKLDSAMWRDGTAVYYISRMQEFTRFPVPYLFDHLWTCNLLTWGTLGIEGALWTLVWIKECRYWVLLAGCLLHLGIEWSMNIPLFELTMIVSYIIFVEPTDLKRAFDRLSKTFEKRSAI